MAETKDDAPHPIDAYVGGRIRLRRVQLGMSQTALAERIGVSFQAVQKYESGDIRISASRLYEAAQVLEAPPAYFFEGYPDSLAAANLAQATLDAMDAPQQREIMSLIRGFYGIRDRHVQTEILRLIARLAQRAGATEDAA